MATDDSAAIERPCVDCDDDIETINVGSVDRRRRSSHLCGTDDIISGNAGSDYSFLLCSPPPKVPDLLATFSDSLRLLVQSTVMHNLTRRLFDAEPTCRAQTTASLTALRVSSVDTADCVDSPAGTPCRTGAAVGRLSAVDRSTATTRRVPIEMNSEKGGRPYFGSREVRLRPVGTRATVSVCVYVVWCIHRIIIEF